MIGPPNPQATAQDRESVYRSRQIGALNKRPLLPRIHRHQLPSPWFNFHNYAFYREDNIMTLQRENFCRRVDEELSLPWIGLVQRADAWHEPTQEYDLLIINYFPVGDEQFTTSLTTILNDLTNFMDVQYPADDVDYQKLAEEKYALNTFPSWVEMFKSTRFFFLNSLPEVDFAQFKIVESIEKTNSLINLTLGTKEGVILVSFGTVVDSLFPTSSHIIEALVETMERFPNYLFIWKQPKGDLPILKEFKLENIVLQNWINQKEILAHPKTMAFVSHCGMNSVMEGTFYGVPMVCMPFFGDQYYNAELLAIQKIGLVIETKNDKQTIQKELNLALSTALGLMKRSEEHFDLDKLKSVSMGIRQKNIAKTISDAMKTIEKEINEKKRQ
ncbi:hypothetical protein GPALN_005746 [Globodera pallida]|nr:hypothetical protein GPALN_005746 [Globodera pallida]